VTPRPALNISFAVILGLVAAVVGVLMRESLPAARQMTPSHQP